MAQQTQESGQYSEYRKQLESAAANWFNSNGKTVIESAPYVLSKRSHWPDNIILQSVADYIEQRKHEAEKAKKLKEIYDRAHPRA